MTQTDKEGNVIYLSRRKRFTLEEARGMVPRIRDLTHAAVEETADAVRELQRDDLGEEEHRRLSLDFQARVNRWADEVTKLGAVPKGLWLVDFDSGDGFYCWRYDEEDLGFFHGYDDGFSGRTPIQ